MESVKQTIKEAVEAIQELDFGEDTCNSNRCIEKNCNTLTFLKYKKNRNFIGHLPFTSINYYFTTYYCLKRANHHFIPHLPLQAISAPHNIF